MSEKKKQEYTTGGLKNRQDVENALASAEYRPSQKVTDAASDLKQWQANRPGDYESAYQGRIDGLMEDLLDRKEFSYSYGADPLYRQYAQLYTQNAQNASADAAAQAAALTGGYGSSYAASAARQAYQQQIGALSEAIPTLYRLALDTYQSGGDALVEQIDQLNGQEQNAQQKYERELADYYTQLEQKGNAYNTAYTQDYGRYQDYLGQLDSLYGYYAAQEQQEAARRQQGFNNVMTVLGVLGDAVQIVLSGTTGVGSMLSGLLNTGYNIYSGNRQYEADRADTQWNQQLQERQYQDSLNQQRYENETSEREYQDKLNQQKFNNDVTSQKLNIALGEWNLKKSNAAQKASRAGSTAAGSKTGGTATGSTSSGTANRSTGTVTRLGSDTSRNVTVPYMAMLMRSQGKSDTSISTALPELARTTSARANSRNQAGEALYQYGPAGNVWASIREEGCRPFLIHKEKLLCNTSVLPQQFKGYIRQKPACRLQQPSHFLLCKPVIAVWGNQIKVWQAQHHRHARAEPVRIEIPLNRTGLGLMHSAVQMAGL